MKNMPWLPATNYLGNVGQETVKKGGCLSHPVHLAVAEAIERQLSDSDELVRDPACGGNQQLPLFVGPRKGRDTRM